MSDPYLGEIRMVGFNFAPQNWALCQGQLMSISQNNALFALLGTFYGGNGTTNFGLPDLQGRSPVGVGAGNGLSPITVGELSGNESVTLTISQLPAHTHTATATAGTASASISIPATTTNTGEGATPGNTTVLGPIAAGGRPGTLYSTSAANTTLAPFNASLTGSAPTVTVGSTGGSLPVALRNPYLGITFIIALSGVFPPRS